MTFARRYNAFYTHVIDGYEFDGGFIAKVAHLSYDGNEVVEGWSVEKNGKRVFFADTLKNAKKFVTSGCETVSDFIRLTH